jgi:hypothetical protein
VLPLPKPNRDALSDLVLAVESGQDPTAQHLRNALPVLQSAYAAYEQALMQGPSCKPVNIPTEQANALKHTYEAMRTRAALKPIREELLAAADNLLDGYCPLCGVEQVSTLDHYAPKGSYPEFAIFCLNLVPCCSRCNQLKSVSAGDGIENIPFVHPYFHAPPAEPILYATVHVEATSAYVRYGLQQPPTCDDALFGKFSNQAAQIRLVKKIERVAQPELVTYSGTCATLFEYGGETAVSSDAARRSADLDDRWGLNNWRSALYRAISANTTYCSGGFRVLVR